MSSSLVYTPIDEIPQIHQGLKDAFASGISKDLKWRKKQLLQLWHLLEDNLDRIRDALLSDLGRAPDESDVTELNSVIMEVRTAHDMVEKWAAPERAPWNYLWFLMSPKTRIEPKGVVLMMTPWNFPIYLPLAPMAAAIAGGNAVLLKPAEGAPASASLLAELIPKYLDNNFFRVVNGGIPEATKVLELQWDHILYTGNATVAKIVMTAAANHLTPLTLELGGKNPAIFDPRVSNLKVAVKRLLWGKLTNAGQICMSPDYAIVPEHFQDTFIQACKDAYYEMHPKDPKETGNMARIVNERQAKRVKRLLDETKGTVVLGGHIDMETNFCDATFVKDVKLDDVLMSEELFAPILPIVPVKDVDEAIKVVNSLGNPLVLHVFSTDSAFKEKVFSNTQSGLAIANETLLHIQTNGIPFGGVGPSGMGATTGKAGFDQFVHRRGSIDTPLWLDSMMLYTRYPPYKKSNLAMMNIFMHPKPPA